jgi:hypothetical protein
VVSVPHAFALPQLTAYVTSVFSLVPAGVENSVTAYTVALAFTASDDGGASTKMTEVGVGCSTGGKIPGLPLHPASPVIATKANEQKKKQRPAIFVTPCGWACRPTPNREVLLRAIPPRPHS